MTSLAIISHFTRAHLFSHPLIFSPSHPPTLSPYHLLTSIPPVLPCSLALASAVSYAYISPSNLSNAFPFFSAVTDVASFDTNALEYFSNPFEFQTTKFGTGELGCTGVPGNASVRPVIRYERTVLCSQWVNEVWSSQCLAFYSGSTFSS